MDTGCSYCRAKIEGAMSFASEVSDEEVTRTSDLCVGWHKETVQPNRVLHHFVPCDLRGQPPHPKWPLNHHHYHLFICWEAGMWLPTLFISCHLFLLSLLLLSPAYFSFSAKSWSVFSLCWCSHHVMPKNISKLAMFLVPYVYSRYFRFHLFLAVHTHLLDWYVCMCVWYRAE